MLWKKKKEEKKNLLIELWTFDSNEGYQQFEIQWKDFCYDCVAGESEGYPLMIDIHTYTYNIPWWENVVAGAIRTSLLESVRRFKMKCKMKGKIYSQFGHLLPQIFTFIFPSMHHYMRTHTNIHLHTHSYTDWRTDDRSFSTTNKTLSL